MLRGSFEQKENLFHFIEKRGERMWASHAVERLDGGQLVDQERRDQ